MKITLNEAAAQLAAHDRILVLSHQSPDGDTLGSAGALCLGLAKLGKQARFVCSDPIPPKYDYMISAVPAPDFEPEYIVAVDIADRKLLGKKLDTECPRIDLCIDHHGSNTQYAALCYVDSAAAATCEIIFRLLGLLNIPIGKDIAQCLFTGISTDTGCFRYANTTPETMRIAAELMEAGAEASEINRQMFEIKTRSRMELERMALDRMEYAFGGKCAMIVISMEMIARSGATEGDLEGLAPLPRNVEGVRVGLTLREKAPGVYKVSVRTGIHVNASHLCARLGGGGHPQASGCMLQGELGEVKEKLLAVVEQFLTGQAV